MTERRLHLASTVPVAFLAVARGYHPLYAVPLVLGAFLPELDSVDSRLHRSWLLHTFLVPAVLYAVALRFGVFEAAPVLEPSLQFLTLGMALHLFADFVYPQQMDHEGATWPVRPVGFSAPWGLIWFGAAWTVQWFAYLAPSFVPWTFNALVPGVSM